MRTLTLFSGDRRLATGSPAEVAAAARAATRRGDAAVLLDDTTGRVVDLRPDGRPALPPCPDDGARVAPRGRGRPKLGVVAREVTLLPRHWDWLARQKGGASATLRRLVEEARRRAEAQPPRDAARERAYRAATVLAGDRSGYEEAIRALFAGDRDGFAARTSAWPGDIRRYLDDLAQDAFV
jgi:hypothetical protein